MQKLDSGNGSSGIKVVRRELKDGTIKEYHYRKDEMKPRRTIGALRSIFNRYSETTGFKRCAVHWQRQALVHMRTIEDELGWMAPEDLEDVSCRQFFYGLQEKFAANPHKADAIIAVLSMALAWAYDRGMIAYNHGTKIKRLVNPRQSPHRDKFYTDEQERLILAGPPHVRDIYEFFLYTALRQGDGCALPPSAMDKHGTIHWQPSKTKKKAGLWVHLPTAEMPPLQAVIGRLHRTKDRLLTRNGVPYTPNYLSRHWPEWMAELGVEGVRFHDIRHTASTQLVLAGCTEAERGLILGHATSEGVGSIYTARLAELATNAYRKWWKFRQDRAANG